MMKSIYKHSDREIQKVLACSGVTEINLRGEPFILKVHKSKKKGTCYFVSHTNGTSKHKIANYPLLSLKGLLKCKDELIEKFALGKSLTIHEFKTVKQVLEWYDRRAQIDKTLSEKRKINIRSGIHQHLIPMLGDYLIDDLSKAVIDEFIFELQENYSIAYIRVLFSILRRAFKQATILNRVGDNFINSLSFGEFVKAVIKPKPAKLGKKDLPQLLWTIKNAKKESWRVFILFMLMHGTRIGETRRLKWSDIDFENDEIIIPEEITKTRQSHTIPLTSHSKRILKNYRKVSKGTFLFSPENKDRFLSDVVASIWVRQVSKKEFSAHDLRKLARTCWADLGIDYFIGELLLNHAPSKLDKTYIHTYAHNQKLSALEKWHDYIDLKYH